ncbi:MAG: aldo/keto reductase, partial [Bacillota bacterium]|nr:aldo/keto reductase [Bacillota bacterium]
VEEFINTGKVGYIGISMHGQPDVLIEALKRYPFEAVMSTINYLDICNFPKLKTELLPFALKKNIAL